MSRPSPRPVFALVAFLLAFAGTALLAGCGVVGDLTGDPDDEETPELDRLVYRAVQRGEDDAPLPDGRSPPCASPSSPSPRPSPAAGPPSWDS